MKKVLKKIGISAGLIVLAAVVGLLLLFISFSIKVPAERDEEVMSILNEEGYHQRDSLRNGKSDYYHEIYPDILDFGMDEYIIKYSVQNPSSSIVRHSLLMDISPMWSRYWHGYVVFLRPLFKFFDLSEVRIINAGIQLFLFALLLILIYKATCKFRYVFAFSTVYFMLIPSATGINFQYSSIYYAAMISAIAFLLWKDFLLKESRYIYLFVLNGALTAYIDFLTYPLLAWALPAAMLLICIPYSESADLGTKKVIDIVLHLIKSAVAWICGYVFFWLEKWALATWLTDENVFDSAVTEIEFRTGIQEVYTFAGRLRALARNFSHLTFNPFVVVTAIWVIYWVVIFLRKGFAVNRRVPALGIMLLSAPAWFFVAANHVDGHHLFAWKNVLGTVIAMLIIICFSTDFGKSEDGGIHLGGGMLKRILIVGACAVLSLVTYIAVPIEKATVHSYNNSTETINLPPGEEKAYEVSFVPVRSRLLNFAPLISFEGTEGYVEMSILRNGKVVHKVKFYPTDSAIVSSDVDWLLKAGEEYTLSFSTENVNAPILIWVDENHTLVENINSERPIAISYTYFIPFSDNATTCFYLMEWFCMYMTIAYIIMILSTGSKGAC